MNHYLRNLAIEFDIPDLGKPGIKDTDGAKCRSTISFLFFKDLLGLEQSLNAFRQSPHEDRGVMQLRTHLKTLRETVISRLTPRKQTETISFASDTSAATRSFDTLFSGRNESATTSFTTTTGANDLGGLI